MGFRFRLTALGDGPVRDGLRNRHLVLRDPQGIARHVDLCPCLLHAEGEELWIEPRNRLSLFDDVIVIDEDFLHLARQL